MATDTQAASATRSPPLPLFYAAIEPLSSIAHADWRWQPQDKAPFLIRQHAVPITVDEFAPVQRMMPIVFSLGDDPVPLALMGLNEGTNVFVGDDGRLLDPFLYVPAYVRRYPFVLARLDADKAELSLCFDPSFPAIGRSDEGTALFDHGEPAAFTREMLAFAENFEAAGQRTRHFMAELMAHDLLTDGETTIRAADGEPSVYRGFRLVDESRLAALDHEQLTGLARSGALPLVYAHLFSLSLMRDLHIRQKQQEAGSASKSDRA